VSTADILLENYRPGVARRLGVGYERLAPLNPRLIYCSISGFGQSGPYAHRGGFDLIAQAMSGIMSATGSDGGAPVKIGVPITDLGAGLFAVVGILCALRARHRAGEVPRGLGTAHRLNAPYQALRANDGHFTVGAANENLWPRFATLLGLSHLITDPRFDSVPKRVRHRAELVRLLEEVTATRTRAHWLAACETAGIPAGPIYTVPEAHADPHAQARGMVQELPHPALGRVKALGNPVKMSATPPRLRTAAPALGADTDAILHELGYAEADIDGLRQRQVV
jgi:formyl-CoA transferase